MSGPLKRIVRAGVVASDAVIEDACQFAWGCLLRHRQRVDRAKVLSWLIATALHEALKLIDRAERDVSLEATLEKGGDLSGLRVGCPPQQLAENRERLASLAALPPRQQTILWLYGLGLSYVEIARWQGSTTRTVERQMQRARRTLRAREAPAPPRDSARLARAASA